jgi:hypothetical protein
LQPLQKLPLGLKPGATHAAWAGITDESHTATGLMARSDRVRIMASAVRQVIGCKHRPVVAAIDTARRKAKNRQSRRLNQVQSAMARASVKETLKQQAIKRGSSCPS